MGSASRIVALAGLALVAGATRVEGQQLEADATVRVRVVTPWGEPIPNATVEASFLGEVLGSVGYCASFSDSEHAPPVPTDREGIATVVWPMGERDLHTLSLTARAPGYAARWFGRQVGREAIGSEQTIVLWPGRALRGRVLFQGKPVAGARIDVLDQPNSDRPRRSWSVARLATPFDVRAVAPERAIGHRTDAEGRYVLTLPTGDYAVRVEAGGRPVALRGPFREPGSRELDVELAVGGAIEGRMLLPEGEPTEGRWVGAAHGWNVVHTAPVDAEGRFRIEGLEPGSYQVRECEGALQPVQISKHASWRRADRPLVWDCIVREAETTAFDLDLRAPESVIAGRFVAPGIDVVHVQLYDADHELRGRTTLAPDGSFRLSAPFAGQGRIALSSGLGSVPEVSFQVPCSLQPGVTELPWIVETGTLVVRGKVPTNEKGAPYRYQAARGELGERSFRIAVKLDDLGRGEVRVQLPAGRMRLTPMGGSKTTLRTIEIRPGAETIVTYP